VTAATTLQLIEQYLQEQKQPPYRVKQVRVAWFKQRNWAEVTTLAKPLRADLAKQFSWSSVTAGQQVTASDGTRKTVLILSDKLCIETVLMPNARDKYTACISSQVGCAMGCTFCATGTMGLKRNLTIDEIVDQVRYWRMQQYDVSNIVIMGMGEPLANYDNIKAALTSFISDLEIGATRIVLSSVGLPIGLERLLQDADFPAVRLALSLHAGTDATRAKIIPAHRGNSIGQLHAWAKVYLQQKGNRRHHLTLEYVLLHNINDTVNEAKMLGKQWSDIAHKIKLNLIPWNTTNRQFQASTTRQIEQFRNIVEHYGIQTTVRYSKGTDIAAACGQLITTSSLPSGHPFS
jgi:23S rRNA (adenine2503-C2)-methyltransferase